MIALRWLLMAAGVAMFGTAAGVGAYDVYLAMQFQKLMGSGEPEGAGQAEAGLRRTARTRRIRTLLRRHPGRRRRQRSSEIEFHRQKPLRAARRNPGQGPPPLRRFFQSECDPAGGQCTNRVPEPSRVAPGSGRAFVTFDVFPRYILCKVLAPIGTPCEWLCYDFLQC